jgi:uncharacterized protein YecT (DUF1311 family)
MSSLTLSRWFWPPRFSMVKVVCLTGACFGFAVSSVHAQTQAEMNAQARKDFERADAELNKIYQSLLAKLAETEAKNKLRESQRAWIAFRDAEAVFFADQFRGGSAAPVLRWGSLTQTTEQRIKQLKADFPDDGDSSNKTLQPTSAEAGAVSERVRDVSPDGKCAMRILYDEELNKKVVENEDNNITDPDFIASETMKTIDLIALPSKEIVAELLKPDGHFEDVTLIWSQDSKWCAFYYAYPRVGYTTVYRENGKKFSDLNAPEALSIPTKGDPNHQHIKPVRWVEPGTLLLNQELAYRISDKITDGSCQFTVKFDKSGKFRVISKKKLPDEDPK